MLTFECTLCGKCCDAGGPELNVGEAIRFSNLFPLAIRLVSVRHGRNPDGLIDHVRSFGSPVTVNPSGAQAVEYLVYGTVFVAVPEGRPCPALSEKLCALHPGKPLACATAPFAAGLPQSLQATALKRWEDWDCHDHAEGAAIYDGSEIVSPAYRRSYDDTRAAMKSEQDLYASLLRRIPDDILPAILEASIDRFTLLPFAEMMPVLRAANVLEDPALAELAAAQARLLDELRVQVPDTPVRGPTHHHLILAGQLWQAYLAARTAG